MKRNPIPAAPNAGGNIPCRPSRTAATSVLLLEEAPVPRDAVEEAGWESFPASDPPAWGKAAEAASEARVSPTRSPPRRARR